MKNCLVRSLIAVATLVAAGEIHAGPVGVVPGRILIKAREGVAAEDVTSAVRGAGGEEVDEIEALGIKVLNVPEKAWQNAMNGLKRHRHIEFAEPDFILAPDFTPNDPSYAGEWHLPKIHADAAWNTSSGNSTIVIAILDTGVDGAHPDLLPNLLPGYNFYDGNSNTSDVHGHGTAVAGVAAARLNNGLGVAGVAGACRLLPIRVSDANGFASESVIARGLTYAADRGARVANISFRTSGSSTIASAAKYFQAKNGVVCIAAGNDGLIDTTPANPYFLTVSATDATDTVTTWSNTGAVIDVAAPGVSILTTTKGGGYASWSGTSFSSPIVAGTAALVLSVQQALTGVQASDIVKLSADDLGSAGFDIQSGAGCVNAARAESSALAAAVVSKDLTAPTVIITSPVDASKASSATTAIAVKAVDNRAVQKVELYVDGKLTDSTTVAPYTTIWNAKKAPVGGHQIETKAYDTSGNAALSQKIILYR